MLANTEIYLTVKNNTTRLVISGELALLREFLTTFIDRGELPPAPVPDPSSALAREIEV